MSPIALLMLQLLAVMSGTAADLELAPPRVKPDGRLEFQFTPKPTAYYRLLRGATPNLVQQPVAIGLTAPLITASETEAYFRLEQIARDAALDTDGDGVNDLAELAGGTNPLVRDAVPARLTRVSSSPADGEAGVSVTRENVLRFSNPLRADATLNTTALFAESGGRRVLARVELSGDRRAATLFYLEPIPAGTFVRVTLLGDKVADENGRRIDADGDGAEGGTRVFQFSTANNRPVPHTAVVGRVFASELVPGPGNVANALNKPLAGVTVTVDGMEETLRAGVDFGRIDVSNFALWTGTEWQVPAAVMPRFGTVDFAVDANRMVAAGSFDSLFGRAEGDTTPTTPAQGIGLWDGSRWGTLGRGLEFDQPAGDGAIRLIAGAANRVEIVGHKVYATGKFTRAGGIPARFYAVWEIAP